MPLHQWAVLATSPQAPTTTSAAAAESTATVSSPAPASAAEGFDDDWEDYNPSRGPFLHHMVAGSMAGFVEHAGIYPIDWVKTHMQANRFLTAEQMRGILRRTSPQAFFRGLTAVFWGCVPAHAMYFSVYEQSKERFGANNPGHHPLAAAASGATATSGAAGSPAARLNDVHRLVGTDARYALTSGALAFRPPPGRRPFPYARFMLGVGVLAAPGLGPPPSLPCKDLEPVNIQPWPFEVEKRYKRADLYPKLEGVYYDESTLPKNPDLQAGTYTESQEIHEVNPDRTLGKCLQAFGPKIVPVPAAEAAAQNAAALAAATADAGGGGGSARAAAAAPPPPPVVYNPWFCVGSPSQYMPCDHIPADLSVFAGTYSHTPGKNWAVVTVADPPIKLVWSQWWSGGAAPDAVYPLIPSNGTTFSAGTHTVTFQRGSHLTHSATGDHRWPKSSDGSMGCCVCM